MRSEVGGEAMRAEPEQGPASRPARSRRRTLLAVAAGALQTLAGFAVYLRLASTRAVNSDGAGQALQAWAMLHGNPLMRGWRLSDVSFYTTELPEYMLVELGRGLNAGVVHIAAAITYTLAVLFAALVARGSATGREGYLRSGLAVGIMLAPQLDDGVNVLISSPDHIGTSVPILLAWLILDRAGRRWQAAVAVPLLLGVAVVADELVLYAAVIPIALACGFRVAAALVKRGPVPWFESGLGLGSLACGAIALEVLRMINRAGGFYMAAPDAKIAPLGVIMGHNLRLTAEGVLLLFGANFINLRSPIDYVFAALHLVGVALVIGAFLLAVWRWRRTDLVATALALGIALNLLAYLISTAPYFLPTTREIAPVLPLAAALAGRQFGPMLARTRASRPAKLAIPVLALVGVGYLAGLTHEDLQPTIPAQNASLTSWLATHHLTDGLSGYWEANVVALTSGGQVRIRSVTAENGRLIRGTVETDETWYDPRQYSANFVVLFPGISGYPGFTNSSQTLATFGKPARTYRFASYTILVWNKNLLAELGS
ncbi:MAG: hypothetical protein ABSA93_06265 [Streptosporangiaceae bacterium]